MKQETLNTSLQYLRSFIKNDAADTQITMTLVFRSPGDANKKKTKANDLLLAELMRTPLFYAHSFGKSPIICLYTNETHNIPSNIDYVGGDALVKKIESGAIQPTYLLAFRQEMPSLTKYSKILGPKGLMPSPKQGTIVEEHSIQKTVDFFKKSSSKIKVHKQKQCSFPIGTFQMTPIHIYENYISVESFLKDKLTNAYIQNDIQFVYLSLRSGPSCAISLKD